MNINPARHLVGRLFLWFWLTTLVTAGSAFWLSRAWNDAVELTTPDPSQLDELNNIHTVLKQVNDRELSLARVLRRAEHSVPYQLIVLNDKGDIIERRMGKNIRPAFHRQLKNIQSQSSPITLRQRGRMLVGPLHFYYQQRKYTLFMTDRKKPPEPFGLISWWIGTGVLVSILLSWLFARTLVKPIGRIQRASQRLAAGDWDARVTQISHRQDELAKLAQNFNRMAEQLQGMWQSQQRLLADISHELRSPLTRLQMALGLASQQSGDTQTLLRIEREADRMEQLINQLLTLARAEASQTQFKPYTLHALLNTVLDDADFEAQQAHKMLTVSALPDITVTANYRLITAAVENIIRNAIRYASSTIDIFISQKNACWYVQVDDDGPGVDKAHCDAIFEPFYRASTARDRASGGVGLGLAIAKAAVTTHHGTIYARPSSSEGFSVVLKIPVIQHHDADKTHR